MNNQMIDMEVNPVSQFFQFAVPAILGMLLISGIIIVDGLFIGRIIGPSGLAGVNLTLPVLYIFLGIAIMTGVGGAVKTGHALGSARQEDAEGYFSFTLFFGFLVVVALSFLFLLFQDRIIGFLNPTDALKPFVKEYLGTLLWFYPAIMMNIIISIFIRSTGKPGLSLLFGLAGNILNIILDYLMIARWQMGLHGAALASGISAAIPLILGMAYFLSGKSLLHFRRFHWSGNLAWNILFNGSSEMVGQFSIGISIGVFNRVILSRLGIDGVSAYTIVGYIAYIQSMIITGFAIGFGPIIGFCHGAGNRQRIRETVKVALTAGFISGAVCWVLVIIATPFITSVFTQHNEAIVSLARTGYGVYSSAFLFNGFNMLISAYFTSVGDARSSVVIASLRGLFLNNLFVLILPGLFTSSGIWLSYPLAELFTLGVTVYLLKKRSSGGHTFSMGGSKIS